MKKLISFVLMLCLFCCIGFSGCTVAGTTDSTTDQTPGSEVTSDTSSEQTSTPEEKESIKVLFLGNSLMFFNDLPMMFQEMARKAGKDIVVDSVTRGSATITDFANFNTELGSQAYNKLTTGNFDYVIIEPSRRITPFESTVYNQELYSAQVIKALGEEVGTETVLYCVWGNNDGTLTPYTVEDPDNNPTYMSKGTARPYTRKAHTKYLKEVNEQFSQALGGVKVIDAGYAFENCIAKEWTSKVNLYDNDQRHPSLEGTYLVAATVFATLYNQSPVNIGYTGGTTWYYDLQQIAKETVLDKVVPNLEEETLDPEDAYNLLVIGSDLMKNDNPYAVLEKMIAQSEGKTMVMQGVYDSAFVFNELVNPNTDYGMRTALDSKDKWDAIILQLSRRNTISSSAVAASELAALKQIYPLLAEKSDNIFIFTLNSAANPAIFAIDPSVANYSKTGAKESCTAKEGTNYFKTLVTSWCQEEDIQINPILYGNVYMDYLDYVGSGSASSTDRAYLKACSMFMSLLGKPIPNTVTETNGIDATKIEAFQTWCQTHCLPQQS